MTPLEKILSSALNEVKGMEQYFAKLEQENANLKKRLDAANSLNDSHEQLIRDLKAQLAKDEPLSNTEELPVYEGEVLQTVDEQLQTNPLEIDGFKADYKALYEAQTKAIIAAKDNEIAQLKARVQELEQSLNATKD